MKNIVLLILALVFSASVCKSQNRNYGYVDTVDYDEVFENNGMLILRKGNKWGAATINKKIVFPPIYSFTYYFPASKTFCVNAGGEIIDGNTIIGGKFGLLDEKGNYLTDIKYTVLYPFEDIDYQFVNEGGSRIDGKILGEITGGKWGLLYKNGKEITPCIYDIMHWFTAEKNVIGVKSNNKWGLINKNGKEIIPCQYDEIRTLDDLYAVKNNDKWGLIDNQGKIKTSIKYDAIQKFNDQNYKILMKSLNGKIQWGILNKNGIELLPCEYDAVNDAYEDIFRVAQNDMWGYANSNGNIIIPIEYEAADPFYKGVARVLKNGEWILVKNPVKEGNRIALLAKNDPNLSAVSRYPAPNSDVDKDIPLTQTNDDSNTFAFIIANENYPEAPVPFALNDGRIFKEYCLKTLGLPAKNIKMFEDASLGRIIAAVEQIKEIADAYDGDAKVIIYYAGHGIPDDNNSTAYLLPVDGSSSDITQTGYSLKKFYTELGEQKFKSATIFLDACFSGVKREDEMLASARGVAIKVKDEIPQGNMIVFSAAQGDETAHQYEEKGHGLFTYFLLKKLQETQGDVTYGELSDYVNKQVKRQSVVINNKRQTPTVLSSSILAEKWQGIKLK